MKQARRVWRWIVLGLILPLGVVPEGFAKKPDSAQKASRVAPAAPLWPEVAQVVGQILEEEHFLKRPVDEEISSRALDRYLEELDPQRLYFYEADVAELRAEEGARFGVELKGGDGRSFRRILERLAARVVQRGERLAELLRERWTFEKPGQAEVSRERSRWPKDAEDALRIWREQIGAELLAEKLEGTPLDEAVQHVRKRHEQMVQLALGSEERERWEGSLKALARSFDAHTEYLAQSEMDDQENELRLSRVGIGVTVEADPVGLRVLRLLPGGPAQTDGRLRVNDRIVALAEGDGAFQELAGVGLARAVPLLRGKKGSWVRLQVVSPKANSPEKRYVIALKRQEMRDVDGEVYGKIIEVEDGPTGRFRGGWISVPGFYGDDQHSMGRRRSSVSRDVETLLGRMKAEKVQGVVMDLRGNLGGLLDEAVELGGLFVGRLPIVLVKASDGSLERLIPTRVRRPIYEGPLVVLTDRQSASASELLAGALQDYRRAVVVGGERTFGKGSVQMTLPLSEFLKRPKAPLVGGLSVSVAKYYRVGGLSTQLVGVCPDIRLPSSVDLPWEGESALKDPLEHDVVDSVSAPVRPRMDPEALQHLQQESARRVARNAEFEAIAEERDRVRAEWQTNRVSLVEIERQAQSEAMHRRYAERQARQGQWEIRGRFYRLQLRDVLKKVLPVESVDPLRSDDPESLVWEAETFRVLRDLASSVVER
jgi:carboxyl-terminal processing protease